MKSDFDGLKNLLEEDLEKFLSDMKDALIPMLDFGLDERLKNDLIRAIHGLKAISGMFELHTTTEFISEVELTTKKIYELNRKDIPNDMLNDLFEIKDQIERLFRYFLASGSKQITEHLRGQNKIRIDEFNAHFIEYKMGKEILKESQKQKAAKSVIQTQETRERHEEERHEDGSFFEKDNIIYFKPSSLEHEDAQRYQQMFLKMLANVKQIDIDLSVTTKIDFAGIQLLQSMKKYCKTSGMKFVLVAQSDVVMLELAMIGVEL